MLLRFKVLSFGPVASINPKVNLSVLALHRCLTGVACCVTVS